MKYEHDNHNTITLHYTERSVRRTLNSRNSERENSKRNAYSKSKQQQYRAKQDERMKFQQCCQRQIQIYI